MRTRTQPQLSATAYHEAGHTVMSLRLRVGIGRAGVSIVPDGEGALGWAHSRRGFHGDPTLALTEAMRLGIERKIMVCMAGEEAQRVFSPRSVREYHGAGDRATIGELLSRLCGSSDEMALLARLLKYRACSIIRLPGVWLQITNVAEALLKKRSLTPREAETAANAFSREVAERARSHVSALPPLRP